MPEGWRAGDDQKPLLFRIFVVVGADGLAGR
jgi:hypothetical protein